MKKEKIMKTKVNKNVILLSIILQSRSS